MSNSPPPKTAHCQATFRPALGEWLRGAESGTGGLLTRRCIFNLSQGACAGEGKRDQTRLATSRATDSPYIRLTVCCTAIRLLRDLQWRSWQRPWRGLFDGHEAGIQPSFPDARLFLGRLPPQAAYFVVGRVSAGSSRQGHPGSQGLPWDGPMAGAECHRFAIAGAEG